MTPRTPTSEIVIGAIARDRRQVVSDLFALTKPRVVLMVQIGRAHV